MDNLRSDILDISKLNDGVYFIALTGVEEIGPNFYLYGVIANDGQEREWLIVDCGIGFVREQGLPGIEIVIPDIHAIVKGIVGRGDKISMYVTHAHEDHIGAIPYLWNELRCPIYTSKIAAAIIKHKFTDMKLMEDLNSCEIHEVAMNSTIKIGAFTLECVSITHSVPEMGAAILEVKDPVTKKVVRLCHTGDWKIDEDPQEGERTNWKALKAAGDKGMLAVIGDSTNIHLSGVSGSESTVKENLERVIAARKKGLIIVTTFASNIARLSSICKAASLAGRKVFLSGRSLARMSLVAKEAGYLKEINEILPITELNNYPKSQSLIICTGCQGEERAAVFKIAAEQHPDITLSKGDLVIFSSKMIPGNEKKIGNLINELSIMDVDIVSEMDGYLHASGHPGQDELLEMYSILEPKYIIPVHGEQYHIRSHVQFAEDHGYKAVRMRNGNVVQLTHNSCTIIGSIYSSYFAVDGNFLLPMNSNILRVRKELAYSGAVFISAIWNRKKANIEKVDISAPGLLDFTEDADLFKEMHSAISKGLTINNKTNEGALRKSIVSIIKKVLRSEVNKMPIIYVHLLSSR